MNNRFYFPLLMIFTASCFAPATQRQEQISDPYNQFASYTDQLNKTILELPESKKLERQEAISKLQLTKSYSDLVIHKRVSADYLALLSGLGDILSSANSEGSSITESVMTQIQREQDQTNFIKESIRIVHRGGMPAEIGEVLQRYISFFNFYGFKNDLLVTGNGERIKIPLSYDLATPLAVYLPNDKDVLNAIGELHIKGLRDWRDENGKGSFYPFLIVKSEFQQHIRTFDPESKFLPRHEVQISSYELSSDYKANEVAADRRYKNKTLLITGTVVNIGKDVLGSAFVALEGAGYFEVVQCYVSDEDFAAALGKGDQINIVGICHGLTLTNVILRNCSPE